jgi:hypothetical protein
MSGTTLGNLSHRLCPSGSPPTHHQDPFTKATKNPQIIMSVGRCIIELSTKKEKQMDNEYIQEIFDQFHAGEIDTLELMDELETARFDGDIIDFL